MVDEVIEAARMVFAHGYTHFKLVEQSRYHQIVSSPQMRGTMGVYHRKYLTMIKSDDYSEEDDLAVQR